MPVETKTEIQEIANWTGASEGYVWDLYRSGIPLAYLGEVVEYAGAFSVDGEQTHEPSVSVVAEIFRKKCQEENVDRFGDIVNRALEMPITNPNRRLKKAATTSR